MNVLQYRWYYIKGDDAYYIIGDNRITLSVVITLSVLITLSVVTTGEASLTKRKRGANVLTWIENIGFIALSVLY